MKASLKTTISIKIYFQRTTWKSCPSCHYSSFTQMLRSHLSRPQGQSPRPGPGQWCPAWRPHCPHPLQSRQLKMFMGTLLIIFTKKCSDWIRLNLNRSYPILSSLIRSDLIGSVQSTHFHSSHQSLGAQHQASWLLIRWSAPFCPLFSLG